MKKRVPPSAHRRPKVAAMCIHNFLFSGILFANTPEINRGRPSRDGKYDVIESESEITEIAIPHITRKAPYPVVMFGIDWPPTVNCSLMVTGCRSSL